MTKDIYAKGACFPLLQKIWSESFDFALSLLLTQVVCMDTYIIMFNHHWFT